MSVGSQKPYTESIGGTKLQWPLDHKATRGRPQGLEIPQKTAGVVYLLPCKDYDSVYV